MNHNEYQAFTVDGRPRCLGGPNKVTQPMLARCFQAMKTLVALCSEVIASEYPSYELLSSLRIFAVSEATRKNRQESADYVSSLHTAAQRLCKIFDASWEDFLQQYWDIKPIACHHNSSRNCSSFESWKFALDSVNRRQSTRLQHPSEQLRWVLIQFGALDGATTSGVEQHFSRMTRIIPEERLLLSEQNKNLIFIQHYVHRGPH